MAKAITSLPEECWRFIAVLAGGDPSQIIWHPATSELEVPDVDQTSLDTTLANYDSLVPTTEAIATKIANLSGAAGNLVISGFQSNAGGLHIGLKWYDSEQEDQLNLVGSASSIDAGESTIYFYRDTVGGTKIYVPHTRAQMKKVLQDGRDRKLVIFVEFNVKKEAVLAATTMAELDAITWTMT